MNNVCCVILAAGEGKRMKSNIPKVLLPVLFKPMLDWVVDTVVDCGITNICVVTGYKHDMVKEHLDRLRYNLCTVVQEEQKGTAHAVICADKFLKANIDNDVLILGGDSPFIDKANILKAYGRHKSEDNSSTIISSVLENSYGYGRIVRDVFNNVSAIVEERDASAEQKCIKEVNSGAYWFKVKDLIDTIYNISDNTSQNEYYLTDSISILINNKLKVNADEANSPYIILGANDCKQLQSLNEIARNRIIDDAVLNGVDIPFRDSVIIGPGIKISGGTRILPGTVLSGKTCIGKGCIIGPHTQVVDCIVEDNSVINLSYCENSLIYKDENIKPFSYVKDRNKIFEEEL